MMKQVVLNPKCRTVPRSSACAGRTRNGTAMKAMPLAVVAKNTSGRNSAKLCAVQTRLLLSDSSRFMMPLMELLP